MKQHYILLLLPLFYSLGINAQNVFIPDTNFRNFLQENYAGCMVGDSLNTGCTEVVQETYLYLFAEGIHDLSGVEYFINLDSLDATYNYLTTLPPIPAGLSFIDVRENAILTNLPSLPQGLIFLYCGYNSLTSLPTLPSTLQELRCESNQLTSLPELPQNLLYLNCSHNQLTSVPLLPQGLINFECQSNQLNSLPSLTSNLYQLACSENFITALPTLPDGLHFFDCEGNLLATLPDLPSSLTYLNCGSNQISILPPLPAGLTSFHCYANSLTSLPSLPISLTYLGCANNQLTALPLLPGSLYELNCGVNLLSYLPALPDGLTNLICSMNQLQCLPFLPPDLYFHADRVLPGNDIICLPNLPATGIDTTGFGFIPFCTSNNIHNCSYYPPVSGYVFQDENDNCQFDNGEAGLTGRIIQLNNNYTITDSNGYYYTVVDTGEYVVYQTQNNSFWNIICPNIPYSLDLVNFSDSADGIDFPNNALVDCSWLWVDIAQSRARRCFQNTIHVNYCNRGTIAEANAYIEITFDPEIIPLSSSLPWTSVSGNTYRFDIGLIDIDECGSFTIIDSVSCDAMLGLTTCATAIIYPISSCMTGSMDWDNSSIEVNGDCSGNSTIQFTVKNSGTGNMSGQSNYRIYEDNILILPNQSFQLNSNDSIIIPVSATGKTYRLEADQRPGHPGNSLPRASIEICGNPVYSLQQITAVAQDDADDYVETDCKIIIASFDPNDKTVMPEGIGTGHNVSPSDYLEYMIRFQNTGTDMAFTVEIIDTLQSQFLDPATFESGVSSHAYTVHMHGNGIVTWRFSNILLPDSNINEPASHGFIKYKIKQRAGNAHGTLINNKAEIYFDYNPAVVTNTAFVTIDVSLIPVGLNEQLRDEITVIAYPNPFKDEVTIEIKTAMNYKKAVVELSDSFGRILRRYSSSGTSVIKINRENFSAGLYFYNVILDGTIMTKGKLVIQN